MSYEFKGTPGPWQVLERGVIAACDECEEWEPTEVGVTPGWSEEDRTMAAAAPELFEALNETLTDLIGYQVNARRAAKRDSSWEGVAEAIQPTIDQARQALAKATGGEG